MCVSQSAVCCFTWGIPPTPTTHTELVLWTGKATKVWKKMLLYILKIFHN